MTPLLFLLVSVVASAKGGWREPCGSYGCPHQPHYEPFVPAPPGHTPRCAKPGQTFCETLENYPQQLIEFLVEKCSYDFSTILKDEFQYSFNSYRGKPEYNDGYEYPRPEVPHFYPQSVTFLPPLYPFTGHSPTVYGPPSNNTGQEGYNYSPPVGNSKNPLLLDSTSKSSGAFSKTSNYWTNRNLRKSEATLAPLSKKVNPFLEYTQRNRNKRQVNPSAIPLCRTNSQYIAPRAAFNSQGNWMYVVNVAANTEGYSQLVKSEKCAVTMCDGICSLPEGYNSRCEQQYIQKRLVALAGSGDRLYTDIFWFPHGCACKIIPTF